MTSVTPNHILLTPSERLGSPPAGWENAKAVAVDERRFQIVVEGKEENARIVFEFSRKDTSRPADSRTKDFNVVVVTQHGGSAAEVHKVLQYYFRLFEANNPAGISRDETPAAPPKPKRSVVFKPTVSAPALKRLSDHRCEPPEPDAGEHTELLISAKLKNVEKAIFISDPYDLKYFLLAPFDRIYFGNEFCESLLPDAEQLERMIRFAKERRVELTLVTPVCTDDGLTKVDSLLSSLSPGTEVVFNDWGVLSLIQKRGLKPVHGRLLCHAKKDPRIDEHTPSGGYHRQHNLQPEYLKYLSENGTQRVEIDNVKQGYDLEPFGGVGVSLYYPHVQTCVTRKCVFANDAARRLKYYPIEDCGHSCGNDALCLSLDGDSVWVQGNAHFYINETFPKDWKAWGVDRIVYEPVIPNHNRRGSAETIWLDWSYVYATKDLEKFWGVKPEKMLGEILDGLKMKPGRTVLDIGCGAGRNAPLFIEKGLKYAGFDIAPDAIAKAKTDVPGGVFLVGDFLTLRPGKTKYDLVVDIGCFHTLPPYLRKEYFKKIFQLVRDGGTFILAAWQSFEPMAPMYYVMDQIPEWGCSTADIDELIGDRFNIADIRKSPGNNQDFMFWVMEK